MNVLNLSELVFKVDTKQLEDAVVRVEGLRDALAVLNKQRTAGSNAEKTSLDLQRKEATLRKALADAARSEATLKKTLERQNKSLSDSTKTVVDGQEKLAKSTSTSSNVLERQTAILGFMTQGFSKGQSSVLAMGQASGLAADQMKALEGALLTMRKLQGGDPFDKSTQGLIALQNAMVELESEQKLVNQGVALTSKQYKDLSRDLQRITEASIASGDSFETMAAKLGAHKQQFIETANSVNVLTREEKERERQMRESANAARHLAAEDDKVNSMLATMGEKYAGNMHASEKAAESVARYARRLKQSGVDGAEAAARLEVYRQKILQVNKVEQQRQKDYLSRALAPQISDVVVSLAGGMNPMTVLMQQGLQVRDLIGQSGVASDQLQESFRNAATEMVASIKGTAAALGSLFLGTILDSGKAVMSFAGNITHMSTVMDGARNRIIAMSGLVGESSAALRAFDLAAKVAAYALGGVLATAFAVVVASAFAFVQVISEQGELSRNLANTGASMGLTKDSAIALANSIEGLSETKATTVLNEMAKAGGFTKEQFEGIAEAAADMEKYVGVSIEDTVKNFAKLRKEPAKALAEFAAGNGQVEVSILKQIKALEDQGKTVEAVDLAIRTYGESQVAVAAIVKSELHPMEALWINIGSATGSAWEALKEFARSDVIVAPFVVAFKVVRNVIYDVWSLIKLVGGAIGTIIAAAAQLVGSGGLEGAANVIRAAKSDFSQSLIDREKFFADPVDKPRSAEKTKKNADDAKSFLGSLKNKPKEKKSDANKGRDDQLKDSIKFQKQLNDLYLDEVGARQELTKVEQKYFEIKSSDEYKSLPEKEKGLIKSAYEKAFAAEKVNIELAKEIELRDIISKNNDAHYADVEKNRLELVDMLASNETLKEELFLMGQSEDVRESLIKKKKEEAIVSKKLDLINLQNIEGEEENVRILERKIELMEEEISLLDQKSAKTSFLELQKNLSDAVETALFEGGKAGAAKIRSVIEDALKKPIRVIIDAVIGNLTGGLSKALEGVMSGTGSVKGIFDSLSGGLNAATGAGQGIFNATSKFVGQFGSNFMTDMVTQFSSGMMSTGSMAAAKEAFTAGGSQMAGVIVGSVMNGISGYGISKAISGGYTTGGNTVNTIAAIASMIPGIGPIAGVIGGLVNRAFGRKLKDTGIQGTLGGETGFEGENYQFHKGGWFRSDKTKTSAMDAGLKKGIGGAFISAQIGLAAMATTLGLATDSIFSFTKAIKISFKGLSQEDAVKKLQEQIGIASNEMAQTLLGTYETTLTYGRKGRVTGSVTTWKPGEFVREGESALEALTRLSTSLLAVNSAFDTLNVTLLQTSLVGGDAASKLLDNFGGIENFNTAIGAYYEAFYTEEERVATTTRQLTAALASMGLTLPATNEAYRALVESQDLYTDSGRATYAALVQLAPTFNTITEAAEAAAEAAKATADAAAEAAAEAWARLSTSLLAVNSAFDKLNVTLLQTSLVGSDAAIKLTDNFGGVENFNTAIGAYYEAFYTEEERVATSTRQLTSALAAMGLTLPATKEAYRALVESQDLYTDSGRATYAALVQLAPTFNTITDAAKATAEAVRDLANSLLDEVKRLRNEIVGSTADSGLAYLQSQFAVTTAQARAGDTTAMVALPELSQAIENAAKLNATSNLDIIRMQAWLADSLSQTATTLGAPAFAAGGIHTGGARIVGENGPELEITGPSRIFSSSQTGDILNNSAVVERLESMNYELQMLRSEVRADVSHNAKTAKLLDRVIPGGDALVVNANIDGGSL